MPNNAGKARAGGTHMAGMAFVGLLFGEQGSWWAAGQGGGGRDFEEGQVRVLANMCRNTARDTKMDPACDSAAELRKQQTCESSEGPTRYHAGRH